MHLQAYRLALERLAYGKRLPGAIYVFREPSTTFGQPLGAILAALVERYEISDDFNLLKFRTDELKISFLSYPDFFDDPHPALRKAITVDLVNTLAAYRLLAAERTRPPVAKSLPEAHTVARR